MFEISSNLYATLLDFPNLLRPSFKLYYLLRYFTARSKIHYESVLTIISLGYSIYLGNLLSIPNKYVTS